MNTQHDRTAEDMTKTPQFNLLYRLREYWGVPAYFTAELERRLNMGKWATQQLAWAERRIAFLEQHVPPEVAHPPRQETGRRGPRFTGD